MVVRLESDRGRYWTRKHTRHDWPTTWINEFRSIANALTFAARVFISVNYYAKITLLEQLSKL